MTIEPELRSLMERFNRRAEKTPAMQEELKGVHRTIAVRLTDAGTFAADLRDGRLQNLRTGAPEKADVTIVTDEATFRGLVAKDIGPMKALVTRKLVLEGSLDDKLLFRRLLS
jgi:putative sterol carrier protein